MVTDLVLLSFFAMMGDAAVDGGMVTESVVCCFEVVVEML